MSVGGIPEAADIRALLCLAEAPGLDANGGLRMIDLKPLCNALLSIADLALYNSDYHSPGKLIVSEDIANFFNSDLFMVVGQIARGEIENEEPQLLKALHEEQAKNRELRNKIVRYEEIEGLYRDVCAQNARLIERIKELA